ncbi:FMN-linked oxidoreductase [Ascobolus immersus RN42]|uniref:Dihydroorotate oxidase n=1 Tax=Ascobolus immersus RN42 TaxID=1160509 RepID=A0A3N4HGN5_ASCIM|nr:FMN-linked oxidoreductase [Ascobolus immersus RN42]
MTASNSSPASPTLKIDPPLLNTACPWATTIDDLRTLYNSRHTGAVTTRTTTLNGYPHDDSIHQYTTQSTTTLNTYGYSPHPLSYYLDAIKTIITEDGNQKKPFIISITGSPEEVAHLIQQITTFAKDHTLNLAIEINLSCPNIENAPPPAYDAAALKTYLDALPSHPTLAIGVKVPPYTYSHQFHSILDTLEPFLKAKRLVFITSCNTLGSCLLLTPSPSCTAIHPPASSLSRALNSADGTGIGGMAGESLHPLALGNLDILRRGLDERGLNEVLIIGVGGVSSRDGYERMRAVGAGAVGVASAIGRLGVGVLGFIGTGKWDREGREEERMWKGGCC